jgi:uncharacterized protein YjbI with pentapeptide repeats
MRAILLVVLLGALAGGALLVLLPAVRRRRDARLGILESFPSSRLPRSSRLRLHSLALASSGDITPLGIALGVALLISAGLAAIFWLPLRLVPSTVVLTHDDRLKLVNDVRTTLLQAVAGLGAIVAAVRTWLAVNERGQITERLNRAVEQLANTNLEVRLAAIFALGQVARNSQRDREAIVQILAGFVRTRSPWPPELPGQYTEQAEIARVPALEVRAADVQAVMTLLVQPPLAGENRRPLQLANTDLRCANLIEANLRLAVLGNANLQGSDLARAQLQEADLAGAQLQGAALLRAELQEADLGGAQLQEANLEDAKLQRTKFDRANLQQVNLVGAVLLKTDVDQADLRGAKLGGADLRQVVHLSQANLGGATIADAWLQGVNLGGAQLQEANLEGAKLKGKDTNLRGAQLQGATLLRADLQEADLGGAQLQGAYLAGAKLQKADLGGAQLQEANLVGADLEETNLADADLSGAQLEGANLDGADLRGVLADRDTVWPEGFNPAERGISDLSGA